MGDGEIEIDESYFGVKRVRGKRGRGANGKVPVFGRHYAASLLNFKKIRKGLHSNSKKTVQQVNEFQ